MTPGQSRQQPARKASSSSASQQPAKKAASRAYSRRRLSELGRHIPPPDLSASTAASSSIMRGSHRHTVPGTTINSPIDLTGGRDYVEAVVQADMPLPPGTVRYAKATATWGDACFRVLDGSGQLLLTIPTAFARAGKCDSNWYAWSMTKACVEDQSNKLYNNRVDRYWSLSLEDPLKIGRSAVCILKSRDPGPHMLKQGPRGCDPRQPHPPTHDAHATALLSQAQLVLTTSTLYPSFQMDVVARDGVCLLSGAHHSECVPTHILPVSCPEYYVECLHTPNADENLLKTEYALLLRQDLARAFEQHKWSLYDDYRRQCWIVHFFDGHHSVAEAMHGKLIPYDYFRGPSRARPNGELLRFHYEQCVMQYFRGHSAGF
ncbi:unnamed protein product [Tilletia controversa]|uniref:HNH nuclease domain-containing protein n=1 Tax=Tilletia controversa TaxID=13291 RepID=A0A8X7SZQ8_9BASI|nr:hypothetical protein CF328_g1354 [Tilletia controversa]KAE8253704.1 hypothetical protein A4X06_0g1262 [Tilletia controversa]CAD6959102.1 unnamed protein product [Tilletia controversa]CAD6981355.1 unnamed protein product [Tilletia controversa]CAD6986412.1 unnamed protein product [Tilletia controversa]